MNKRTNVVVMDLYAGGGPAAGIQEQSALSHIGIVEKPEQATVNAADLLLQESATTGLLVLRAGAMHSELSAALQSLVSVALPERLWSDAQGHYCSRWMSPDEWLLSCPLHDVFRIETALRETVSGHVAIVNVSGGYSVMTLSGSNARLVLKKSTAYDCDPRHLPVGKVVNTHLAKSQVTLRAVATDSFEILVRRSFADYVWLWLQHAGAEYGMSAVTASGQALSHP